MNTQQYSSQIAKTAPLRSTLRRGLARLTPVGLLLASALACLPTPSWAAVQAPQQAVTQVPSITQNQTQTLRRYALVIGSNQGTGDRLPLKYATTDARTFARVLSEMGGVQPEDQQLLLEPSRKRLDEAVGQLQSRLTSTRRPGERSEVVIYYSGHSDEQGLMLGQERWDYPEIRKALDQLPADVRIAILDSCSSGALIRTKGGTRKPPFLMDASSSVKGYAFLTSSAEDEAAQESERLKGSFFTQALVTGLRGAADSSRDGRVTLHEAYQFAFHNTLAKTEHTAAGPQHPGYDMRLVGSGDLVLTDLRSAGAGVVLDPELVGDLYIRDADNHLVAELKKGAGQTLELAFAPGRYRVTLVTRGQVLDSALALKPGERISLSETRFKVVAPEPTARRGGQPLDGKGLNDAGTEVPSGWIPAEQEALQYDAQDENTFSSPRLAVPEEEVAAMPAPQAQALVADEEALRATIDRLVQERLERMAREGRLTAPVSPEAPVSSEPPVVVMPPSVLAPDAGTMDATMQDALQKAIRELKASVPDRYLSMQIQRTLEEAFAQSMAAAARSPYPGALSEEDREELQEEVEEALEEAQEAVEEAKEEVEDAQSDVDDAHAALSEARSELEQAQRALESVGEASAERSSQGVSGVVVLVPPLPPVPPAPPVPPMPPVPEQPCASCGPTVTVQAPPGSEVVVEETLTTPPPVTETESVQSPNSTSLWFDELGTFHWGMKRGGQRLFFMAGAGIGPSGKGPHLALSAGGGVHLWKGKHFFGDLLVTVDGFFQPERMNRVVPVTTLRAELGLRLGKRFNVVVGPEIRLTDPGMAADLMSAGFNLEGLEYSDEPGSEPTASWTGLTLGVQF